MSPKSLWWLSGYPSITHSKAFCSPTSSEWFLLWPKICVTVGNTKVGVPTNKKTFKTINRTILKGTVPRYFLASLKLLYCKLKYVRIWFRFRMCKNDYESISVTSLTLQCQKQICQFFKILNLKENVPGIFRLWGQIAL